MNAAPINPIEAAEREIRRDSDDLTRLKQRYPGYDFVFVGKDGNLVTVQAKTVRGELSEMESVVLQLVNSSPETEWTSRSVLSAIQLGALVRLPEKPDAAMNAVGWSLIALMQAGRITRTHQGRGRDPHRYIANKREDKNETPA
jgi:hypothetical protein